MSVKVIDVSKCFGAQRALDGVSFEVAEGEIVGFLGPNGAGKSTLMKIATGYLSADSGRVEICGVDVAREPERVRRLVGYLPEQNPLYTDMYVREYLTMVAGLYNVPEVAERVEEMIELTGLQRECHKKIGALSKGYRQRVGIAQALLPDPRVVILDEPTTGLDPNQLVEIRELIRNVGRSRTVLLSTHIMQEVEAMCNSVVIIDRGVVKAQGKVTDIARSETQAATYDVGFSGEVDEEALREVLRDFASRSGVQLQEMSRSKGRLEQLFHSITQR